MYKITNIMCTFLRLGICINLDNFSFHIFASYLEVLIVNAIISNCLNFFDETEATFT